MLRKSPRLTKCRKPHGSGEAMDSAVLKDKLMKGSFAGMLRVGVAIPLYFVLTPYALSRLGTVMFGIWSFSTIMISLVNLTDFGFKNSLIRYVAMNLDRKEEIGRYFSAAFWMYSLLSVVFMTFIVLFSGEIVSRLLRVPPQYHNEATFVILVSAGSFALRFIASPFQSVIEGFQEHFYSQSVSLCWVVVNSAGSMVALALRPDVYTLGAVSVAANVMILVLFVLRVRARFPFARILPGSFDRTAALNLFRFGAGIQVATLVIALREPIFKILISRTGDLESLASFEVAYRLCTQLVSIIVSPLLGTFAASALLCNKREELAKVLRPILGFTCTALIPAVLFLGSFSPKLIAFWLGHEAGQTAIEVFLIFAAFAIYYATEPLYKAIEGSGASWYSAFVQLFSMAISAAAFVFLGALGKLTISGAIFFGFAAFSISNYLVFRRRFRGMVLIRSGKLLLLLCPALAYACIGLLIPQGWLPALFLIYLPLHLIVALKAKVFDFIGHAASLLNSRRTKTPSPRNEETAIKA